MNRRDAERKRDRAIKTLRDLGMTDEEIAAELGEPTNDDELVIDVEAIEIEDESPDPGLAPM